MIDPEDELQIRRFIATDRIDTIPGIGRVVPAPIYFEGKEDYWATIESVSYETQQEIEKTSIKFVSFYPKGFTDDRTPPNTPDSPLVTLTYEVYLFHQYDYERSDENLTPDAFNKKMLKSHNDFIAIWLQLKASFQGLKNMGLTLSEGYATQRTTSLIQNNFIENKVTCRFIPGVVGYSVTFDEGVQLKLVAC